MTNEEIELAVDAAFLKLFGKTYREAEPPQSEGDSLAKIVTDFPELFRTP